jgi:hypothetical protein
VTGAIFDKREPPQTITCPSAKQINAAAIITEGVSWRNAVRSTPHARVGHQFRSKSMSVGNVVSK